ncbi:MAG TPA: penicillin acylase family protein [Steroidobacteraceae bacterium]
MTGSVLRQAVVLLAFLCAAGAHASGGAQIRRTADGIPHILAKDWRGLGQGIGFAEAQDALCTLAEAFVTYEGRRSYFFGADAHPADPSMYVRASNLDLDTFVRVFLGNTRLQRFEKAQPSTVLQLAAGFASGYNEYVRRARADAGSAKAHPCLDQSWIRDITREDVTRRMLAVGIAAGYGKFIPEIVNAAPGGGKAAAEAGASLAGRARNALGESASLGSNVLAFGGQVTGADGVLVGNPHWFWSGPDRFYQMQLTIPGTIDVAGVAFLAIPLVMIGFNDSVAWSHTVSAARRFGLFELKLEPGHPDEYRYDGQVHTIKRLPVEIEVRAGDGTRQTIHRVIYRSHLGPMIDLGGRAEGLRWGAEGHALAIKDVNEDNFRLFRNFLRWDRAKSLTELAAIQREETAIPWVHTMAVGRRDARVWYADIGPVPDVPDDLRKRCSTPLAELFAAVDATVAFLDGSRSECTWKIDQHARQAGAMPAQQEPSAWRTDYAASMNGSYWPINTEAPLTGYPITLGGEREALSLRARLGYEIAHEIVSSHPHEPADVARMLQEKVLDSRAYSAELFKAAVLEQICRQPAVEVSKDSLSGRQYSPARHVELGEACAALRSWQGTANPDDGGAVLWNAFWDRVVDLPEAERYRVPFSPDQPLLTPNALNVSDPLITQALGAAVSALADTGVSLTAPVGKYLRVGNVPLFGGCNEEGYFTSACDDDGAYRVTGPHFLGNTYLQVVRFDSRGVRATTLLSHGERERGFIEGPLDPGVRRYAAKDWLEFPFSEKDISKDPALTTIAVCVARDRRCPADGL